MSVSLSSVTITTDAFAGLSSTGVTYTTASVGWTNLSSSSSDFRIVNDDLSIVSDNITVAGGASGSHTVTGLDLNSTVKLFLQRYEVDSWVQQTSSVSGLDYVEATTYTSSISLNVGSTSASLSWTNPGSSTTTYIVHYIREGFVNDSETQIATVVDHSSTLTNLTQGQGYRVMVSVIEGETTKMIGDILTFTTSAGAAMVITEGPFASYISLDWGDSVDGTGANYRIANRDVSGGGDDILVESSAISSAIIADLEPGTSYVFVLQRLELGENWSDQSQSLVTTPTSSMTVGSIGSATLEVSWGNLYDGAQFEVLFNGESAGITTETSMVLRDLSADTSYTLELNVLELGESLGLSSLGLSTNQTLSQKYKLPVTIPVVTLVLLIILFLMKKK